MEDKIMDRIMSKSRRQLPLDRIGNENQSSESQNDRKKSKKIAKHKILLANKQ